MYNEMYTETCVTENEQSFREKKMLSKELAPQISKIVVEFTNAVCMLHWMS